MPAAATLQSVGVAGIRTVDAHFATLSRYRDTLWVARLASVLANAFEAPDEVKEDPVAGVIGRDEQVGPLEVAHLQLLA